MPHILAKYLSSFMQAINIISTNVTETNGIKQGGVTFPILFNIFTSGITLLEFSF